MLVSDSFLSMYIYIGICILKLTKTLMYEFHYNYIKKKYDDSAMLLYMYTDTDFLAYKINTDDFYISILLMMLEII